MGGNVSTVSDSLCGLAFRCSAQEKWKSSKKIKQDEKKPCQTGKIVLGLLHYGKAMKETLFLKLDRNLASPTESANGREGNNREHSGADCLKQRYGRMTFHKKAELIVGQYVARVKCKKRGRRRCLQCGWYRG